VYYVRGVAVDNVIAQEPPGGVSQLLSRRSAVGRPQARTEVELQSSERRDAHWHTHLDNRLVSAAAPQHKRLAHSHFFCSIWLEKPRSGNCHNGEYNLMSMIMSMKTHGGMTSTGRNFSDSSTRPLSQSYHLSPSSKTVGTWRRK
jgi:hypothetical protein